MNNGTIGNYALTVSHEQAECLVCGVAIVTANISAEMTLGDFVQYLKDNERFQLSDPSISRNEGAPIFFANNKEYEKKLESKLTDFISSGEVLLVTDTTYPTPVMLQISFE